MEDKQIELLSQLLEKLRNSIDQPITKKVFVGFDGFVDKIMKAVKQKENFKSRYFETIQEFASRINSASGKSGQIELVLERTKLGGNAPILSNTLGKLGIRSYCVGSLGIPETHPVFSSMDTKCDVISLQNPGDSTAIEFTDGKIILSELSAFSSYDWKFIKNSARINDIRKAIMQSKIIAFVDWVNLPYASEIWEGILDDIIKPSGRHDFDFLFDLCDPSKKTTEQIDEILDTIGDFSSYGKVTLGLNENETLKIWAAIRGVNCDDPIEKTRIPAVKLAGRELYKALKIDRLLVHPIDRTIVYHGLEEIELSGRVVKQPKVLTGGGDNLNAGYCLGLLLNLPIQQCMLLGMAASGAYIQNGASPDIESILQYLEVWIQEMKSAAADKIQHVFSHRHE
jgi:hypothetical protein